MELLAIQTANAPFSVAWMSEGKIRELKEIVSGTAEQACDCVSVFARRFGRADGVIISSGPGSWTGTRTGSALAEGLRLGWQSPVFGINAFEAMSFAARGLCSGAILCVVDSRRDALFWQLRDAKGTEHTPIFCDLPEAILRFASRQVSGQASLHWAGFCPPPFAQQEFVLNRPAHAGEMALAVMARAPDPLLWPDRLEILYECTSLDASTSAASNSAIESGLVSQLATKRTKLGSL